MKIFFKSYSNIIKTLKMYDMYASVEIRGDGRKTAKLYSLEMHV